MASNQTSNFGLSIWKPEDNFLRTEFNEDHEKIDAALAALAAQPSYVPLIDTNTKSAATQVSAALDGIDLTAWHTLELRFSLPTHDTTYLRFNGRSDSIYYSTGLGTTYNQQTAGGSFAGISWSNSSRDCPLEIAVQLPLYMREWNVSAQYSILCLPKGWRWHSHGFARADGLAWSELNTVDVVGTIPVGTRVQVWGVK